MLLASFLQLARCRELHVMGGKWADMKWFCCLCLPQCQINWHFSSNLRQSSGCTRVTASQSNPIPFCSFLSLSVWLKISLGTWIMLCSVCQRKKNNQKTEGKLVVLRLVLGRVLSGSPLSSSLPICVQVYWLFVLFEQMPQTKTGWYPPQMDLQSLRPSLYETNWISQMVIYPWESASVFVTLNL